MPRKSELSSKLQRLGTSEGKTKSLSHSNSFNNAKEDADNLENENIEYNIQNLNSELNKRSKLQRNCEEDSMDKQSNSKSIDAKGQREIQLKKITRRGMEKGATNAAYLKKDKLCTKYQIK